MILTQMQSLFKTQLEILLFLKMIGLSIVAMDASLNATKPKYLISFNLNSDFNTAKEWKMLLTIGSFLEISSTYHSATWHL